MLPHTTAIAPGGRLSEHATNVLSDLCGSLRGVAEMAGTEEGGRVLGEWVGREGEGVREFWGGEWVWE